jgi:hypothetical protein
LLWVMDGTFSKAFDCILCSWPGITARFLVEVVWSPSFFFFLSLRGLWRLPQSCTLNDVWLGSLFSKMCSHKPACLATFLCLDVSEDSKY